MSPACPTSRLRIGRPSCARAGAGADIDELQVPLFALVREAAARTVGLRPFDVQVVAALALAQGRVVETALSDGDRHRSSGR